MTIQVKHAFQSALPDGSNGALVQPSNWNDDHQITIASGKLVGRLSPGDGPAEEIDTSQFVSSGSFATVATTGDYADLTNKPALGTAASENTTAFASAAQGVLADTAVQPSDIGESVQAYSSVLAATTASFTTSDESKLDGIASGATANSSDAHLLNRSNHTGVQSISTITGLETALDGKATVAQGALADTAVQPNTSPTFASLTTSDIIGGAGVDTLLTIKQTSGSGSSGGIRVVVGNNGAVEAFRVDAFGRILIGSPTSIAAGGASFPLQQHGGSGTGLLLSRFDNGAFAAGFRFLKSRSTVVGGFAAVQNGDDVADWVFCVDDGTDYASRVAALSVEVDGTSGVDDTPGRINLATTADGSATPSTSMQLRASGAVSFNRITTTGSAANAYLDSGANNSLMRSTSSARYKTDVENLDAKWADPILNLRPIWYRSLAEADQGKSYYGLIAEEVAAIDPRLVNWGYPDEAYEHVEVMRSEDVPVEDEIEVEEIEIVDIEGWAMARAVKRKTKVPRLDVVPVFDADGRPVMIENGAGAMIQATLSRPVMTQTTYPVRIDRRLRDGAKRVPDGVAYDRLTVFLLHHLQRQHAVMESMERRIAALERA